MKKINFPKIYPVTCHTEHVGEGTTFVGIDGARFKATDFLLAAINKGAKKIVLEKDKILNSEILKLIESKAIALEFVEDARKYLAINSAKELNYPAKKLKIIGVTGTKGKTSTAFILYNLLLLYGKKVALISTIEKLICEQKLDIKLTTPLADDLQIFLSLCVEAGVEYCVMEVSAQALTLKRVEGIEFEYCIFTNFSMEHLEFYKSMDEYFEAKKLIFNQVSVKSNILINCDDKYGQKILQESPEFTSYSLENNNSFIYGSSHQNSLKQILHYKIANQKYTLSTNLLGKFNLYNLLAVLGVCNFLKFDMNCINDLVLKIRQVPGRMERYMLNNGAQCFIDYAHNPSSFFAVLSTLRLFTKKLIVVTGAGGSRGKGKRPVMGSIIEQFADIVILTADNPRFEDPFDIINDIASGFSKNSNLKVLVEIDRIEAIKKAYLISDPESLIAILGKGHDEFQIVGDLVFPFKERLIIKEFLL